MRITDVATYLVGNPWKSWLLVKVSTDEGITGAGEGTLNAFGATVATAINELRDSFIGLDPSQVELLRQRMVRDVYSDGGQIQQAALAAVEVACWDIVGKAQGRPVHALLGGRVRDRVRVYANGWYRHERTPEAFAASARAVVARGYTALKFDPFGATSGSLSRREEELSIEIVAAVRDAVGPDVDVMVEAHSRFNVAAALRVAERLSPYGPAWLEEPVPHQHLPAVSDVARRSPVPIATGESYASIQQFAALLAAGGVSILQPEPLHLGGLWHTRLVAAMADAHQAVVAPHNAQGPVCAAISLTLGACVPNFYLQESFDEFNAEWSRQLVDPPLIPLGGHLDVRDTPGLGIEVDWERLSEHPATAGNVLRLFSEDWHLRAGDPRKVLP